MSAKSEQKERTRAAVLASAARLLREAGVAGASVANVMKGIGLTVGGFYAHFDSKDALVAAVLSQAFREQRAAMLRDLEGLETKEAVQRVLQRYLSASHRDHPEHGCVMPAVVSEITREGEASRRVLGEEIDGMARAIATATGASRGLSLGLVALMFGGLSLSRALAGSPLSDQVLKAARELGYAALRGAPKG